MEIIGYLFVGLIAGAVSGWFVGIRSVNGFLSTLAVGIVGAAIGGWLTHQLGAGANQSLFGAAIFAVVGAIIVRVVLRARRARA